GPSLPGAGRLVDRGEGRARARCGARGASARGGDPGRDRRLLRRRGAGGDSELARLLGRVRVDPGLVLRVRLRGRGRRPADRAPTGNAGRGSYRSPPSVGMTNLILQPREGTLDELVARAGDGLYVTDVAGLHSGVNPVSGTFSVGASGRLIENGELGRPVRELTIASDLVSMLRAGEGVGSAGRWVPLGVRGVDVHVWHGVEGDYL